MARVDCKCDIRGERKRGSLAALIFITLFKMSLQRRFLVNLHLSFDRTKQTVLELYIKISAVSPSFNRKTVRLRRSLVLFYLFLMTDLRIQPDDSFQSPLLLGIVFRYRIY